VIVEFLLAFERTDGDIAAVEILAQATDVVVAAVADQSLGTYIVDPNSITLNGE